MQTEDDRRTEQLADMGALGVALEVPAETTPDAQDGRPTGPAYAPGVLRASPTKMGQRAQCEALAGFSYTTDSRQIPRFMVAATMRGRAIHAGVDGILATGEAPPSAQVPVSTDDDTTCAQVAEETVAYLRMAWPGYTWISERDASREIPAPPEGWPALRGPDGKPIPVPAIWLMGRIDYLGQPPVLGMPWVFVDLKSRAQVSPRLAPVTKSLVANHQMSAYDYIAESLIPLGQGPPQLWLVTYHTKTGRFFRREYPTGPGIRAAVLRMAADTALAVGQMRHDPPSTWRRSFQCDKPYPCPHMNDCSRALGAYYPRRKDSGDPDVCTDLPAYDGEDAALPPPPPPAKIAGLESAFGGKGKTHGRRKSAR